MTARWLPFIAVAAFASCSLTTDLSGLFGGADPNPDGGPPDAATGVDANGAPVNRIYVAGGMAPAESSSVFSSPIAGDGSLGAWTTEPALPKERSYAPSFVSGDSWYLLGGDVNPGTSSNVARGRLESTRLLSWETAPPLAMARIRHGAAYSPRGFVYVVGGSDSNDAALASTEFASVTAQGIDGFRATTPLPVTRTRTAAAATERRVYVVCGTLDSTGTRFPEIFTAPIQADGSLGPWFVAATMSPPREHMRVNVVGQHLLITGGSGAQREVVVADLDADGAITGLRQTTPLPADRILHTVVVARGFVFVLGGLENGTEKETVLVAPISADATVGAWRTTTSLPVPLAYHAAAAY
jgi:hypothetical protein